jgi:hypothetical protein
LLGQADRDGIEPPDALRVNGREGDGYRATSDFGKLPFGITHGELKLSPRLAQRLRSAV